MKKVLFIALTLISVLSLLFICDKKADTQIVEPTDLIEKYYNNGVYTKKTQMYLNGDAEEEFAMYFHANRTPDRTTYYKPGYLTMVNFDGTEGNGIEGIYSEFRNTVDNDGTNRVRHYIKNKKGEVVSDYSMKNTTIANEFVVLEDMLEEGYFTNFTTNNGKSVYTVNSVKTGEVDTKLHEFLWFTAPGLYDGFFTNEKFAHYITQSGVRLIVEEFSGCHGNYLSFRIVLNSENDGVVIEPAENILSEARVYVGNDVFSESDCCSSLRKFDTKLENVDKYIYRVGNQNAVSLSSLFRFACGISINSDINFEVEAVGNSKVSGTYIPNSDPLYWEKGTVKFEGTGLANIKINDYTLLVEVVDAVNATSAASAKSNNVVLLNNIEFSTIEVSNGYTLYGNGFKMTASNDVMYDALGVGFVTLKNGTLDNVQIICPNFSYSIIYSSNVKDSPAKPSDSSNDARGNVRSAIIADGNSKILNSYVSGGRAAVFLRSGNLLIENSTIHGGAAANIHAINAKSLTLRDATLIQEPLQATVHDTSKTLMGFGVLFECDENGNSTPLIIEGKLIQHAWISESDKAYISDSSATVNVSSIISNALSKENFLHDIDKDGKNESLNLGFTYIPASLAGAVNVGDIIDNRSNKNEVPYEIVNVSGAKVYSYKNTNGTSNEFILGESYEYHANKQMSTLPSIKFTDTNDDRVFETIFDSNDGRWESTLTVNLDKGNYDFNFSNLVVEKYGENLSYTVSTAEGNDIDTSKNIALTSSGVTNYVLTIEDGNVNHTFYFTLTATKTSIPEPVVADTTGGTPLLVVKSKGGDWSCAIPALEGIKVQYYTSANNAITLDLASLTPTSTGKQNGTNNYWTITKDGYTLKVTCGYIHDTKQVYGMPVVVNNGGNKLYFTISSTNGYVSTSTASRTVTLSYEFTDPNGKTLTFSKTWQFNYADYKNGTQYSYSDFVNGNLKAASGVCLAPDTLITLANGTQKQIKDIKLGDEVVVWDFHNGEYTVSPVSLIQAHDTGYLNVLYLHFEDGTTLKVLGEHGIFDTDLNTFIFIDEYDVESYIGHSFAKQDGTSFTNVKLVGYEVKNEYTTAYTILSTSHYNVMAEGMFTVTPAHVGDNFFNPFDINDELRYDEAAVAADIEKYGLYTYEDFAHVVTYEQFVALNLAQFKVSVGKGYVTYEGLIFLIENFINNAELDVK